MRDWNWIVKYDSPLISALRDKCLHFQHVLELFELVLLLLDKGVGLGEQPSRDVEDLLQLPGPFQLELAGLVDIVLVEEVKKPVRVGCVEKKVLTGENCNGVTLQ